jgi:P2 family phage contractile tail tube protein
MRNLVGDFELYAEGFGYGGLVESVKAPDLKWKREDYVGGGLMGTREMGLVLDKLEMSFKSASMLASLMSQWGMRPGTPGNWKIMGSLIVPGSSEVPFKVRVTGQLFDLSRDDLKPGAKTTADYKIGDITYYEETVDGAQVWEIDLVNMILKNNGVDQMVDRRRNLGRV